MRTKKIRARIKFHNLEIHNIIFESISREKIACVGEIVIPIMLGKILEIDSRGNFDANETFTRS